MVLEQELAQMKQMVSQSLESKQPWWVKIAGSFESDASFEQVKELQIEDWSR